jgi:hypothetical protein
MPTLIDIVNFNPDASCLSSSKWMSMLNGGKDSLLFRWLNLYKKSQKKINIGFTGAALVDIATYNKESIDLITQNNDIFKPVLRPFSHDISTLRTSHGFKINFLLGAYACQQILKYTPNLFLPPEFIITSRQLYFAYSHGVSVTLLLRDRFRLSHLPSHDKPIRISLIPNKLLKCHQSNFIATSQYLKSIQLLDDSFNEYTLKHSPSQSLIMWRDGESPFLLPDPIERESIWLKNSIVEHDFYSEPIVDDCTSYPYPMHPMSSWLSQQSMMWLVHEINRLEGLLKDNINPVFLTTWLGAISSDNLSSIEKSDVNLKLNNFSPQPESFDYSIKRANKAFEAEQWLTNSDKKEQHVVFACNSLRQKFESRSKFIQFAIDTKPDIFSPY